MDQDTEARRQRETFLSTMLGLLGVSVILFFFFIICGGLFIYVLAVVAGITLIGLCHYLLWGHSMTEQIGDEQEEEESRR